MEDWGVEVWAMEPKGWQGARQGKSRSWLGPVAQVSCAVVLGLEVWKTKSRGECDSDCVLEQNNAEKGSARLRACSPSDSKADRDAAEERKARISRAKYRRGLSNWEILLLI